MKKGILLITLLVVLLVGTISASVDSIDYPYEGQILNSPTIDLEVSTTGATSCFWGYADFNTSINCNGEKIRLPISEGNYNLSVRDNTGSVKTINITLDFPSGLVVVFFSTLFIILCFEMLGLLLWTLLHFLELNIDAKDLILNVSSYFGLWALYLTAIEYLGNPIILDFLEFLIDVGSVTAVLIPIIGFVVSFFKQNTEKGDHN